MAEIVYAYIWVLFAVTSGIGSVFFFKKNFNTVGSFVAVSSLILGVAGALGTFYGVSGIIFRAIGLAGLVSWVGMIYLISKNTKALVLSVVPLLFLFPGLSLSLSVILLGASLTLIIGVSDAHDYSRLDVSACMKHSDNRLRFVLSPLSQLQDLANRNGDGSRPVSLLWLSYSVFFSLVLVVIPVLVYLAIGGIILPGIFQIASLGYLMAVKEECSRGLSHLGKSREMADTHVPT